MRKVCGRHEDRNKWIGVRAGAGGNKHEPTGARGVLDLDLGSLAHTKTMKEPSKNLEWNNQKISKTQQESLIYIRRLIRSNIIQ